MKEQLALTQRNASEGTPEKEYQTPKELKIS